MPYLIPSNILKFLFKQKMRTAEAVRQKRIAPTVAKQIEPHYLKKHVDKEYAFLSNKNTHFCKQKHNSICLAITL
jgi:hypothetical protein